MMNYPSRVVSVKRVISFVILAGLLFFSQARWMQAEFGEQLPSKLKTSLNAYSFNGPLSDGSMDLDSLLEYCASEGFDAVDITAYYFPGYPAVPSDEYLYHIKRKSFRLGLEISGTGVRNDFTNPDPAERRESILLVKSWIIAAEKLGAPVIRIFAGKAGHEGYTRGQLAGWLVEDIKECVEFGKQHGVVVAVQNHNDFFVTADQVVEIMEKVDSEWFGLILDIGSFRKGDFYGQVEQAIPWAVSWQIKEQIYMNGKGEKPDLARLLEMIKESGYRGYVPIETLGQGDPVFKVHDFFTEFKEALENVF